MRLKIRSLCNFDKHPHAPNAYFDFLAPIIHPLETMSTSICGHKVAISLKCAGGSNKQLILNWRTFQATVRHQSSFVSSFDCAQSSGQWMEDQDVHFVKADYLLGTKISHNKPIVRLYNVADLSRVIIEREYELPMPWSSAQLSFAPNVALTGDAPPPARALFYADPNTRILALSATTGGTQQWLIARESFFRPTSRPDKQIVPWTEWCNWCLIKNAPALVRDVQVVGNRIIYLEAQAEAIGRVSQQRIGMIEFPPYPDPRNAPKSPWFHVGPGAGMSMIPTESFKEVSSRVTQGEGISSIAATEDNIVLFLVSAILYCQ